MRSSSVCEDVSPKTEERPLLADVESRAVKTVIEYISMCVIVICEV
jgi:hypothetical protein